MATGPDAKGTDLVSMPADWTLADPGADAPSEDPVITLTDSARDGTRADRIGGQTGPPTWDQRRRLLGAELSHGVHRVPGRRHGD